MKLISPRESVQATLSDPRLPLVVREGPLYEHNGVRFVVEPDLQYDWVLGSDVYIATEQSTGLRLWHALTKNDLLNEIERFLDGKTTEEIASVLERGREIMIRYRKGVWALQDGAETHATGLRGE